MKLRLLVLFFSLSMVVQAAPALSNEIKKFPCVGGGTYSVSIPDGVAFDYYLCRGSLTIDSSVKTIEDGAFEDSDLTSVTIPNSVTSIGVRAFADSYLTSVTLGNSVTSIGAQAFVGTSLTSVTIPNSVTSIGERAFAGTYLTSVTIGNSVSSIGELAFTDTLFTFVAIPSSMTIIGERAFERTAITSVIIPNSVIRIGERAFAETRLTSVTIPDSVTMIDKEAFSSIATLATVFLSKNLKFLGANAFGENRSLTRIEYCGNLTGIPISPVCPEKAKAEAEAKISNQKSITCVKGKSSLKVIGKSPKCPKGYKKK